eukprot:6757696-Prymnesium_polylepis.1
MTCVSLGSEMLGKWGSQFFLLFHIGLVPLGGYMYSKRCSGRLRTCPAAPGGSLSRTCIELH